MAKHLNRPAPNINVPPLMTKVAWKVEWIRSLLTGSKPEITREMATTTAQIYAYANEKIIKTLDFEFTPVEKSIQEICEFFLQDQMLNKNK